MSDRATPTPLPQLLHISAQQAVETLGYAEMIALSEMFDRWALTETKISGAQRAKLIEWSWDYAALAEHCGPDWTALDSAQPQSLLAFVAAEELKARQSRQS